MDPAPTPFGNQVQQLHPKLPYVPPVAPKLPKERFLTARP